MLATLMLRAFIPDPRSPDLALALSACSPDSALKGSGNLLQRCIRSAGNSQREIGLRIPKTSFQGSGNRVGEKMSLPRSVQ